MCGRVRLSSYVADGLISRETAACDYAVTADGTRDVTATARLGAG
jgi:hypothetical protein